MNEHRIPTDEELDALLKEPPQFSLDAVKDRTLSRVQNKPRKTQPLRWLCIAAVVCTLSATALASVTDTTIAQFFRFQRTQMPEEPVSQPTVEEPIAEEPAPIPEPASEPEPEPEPEPAPPVLDTKIVEALELTEQQVETLRPAAQDIQKIAENQGVTMTVLQTLGDDRSLLLTVRFDFPKEVPAGEELDFKTLDFHLTDGRSFGQSYDILERTKTSVTYLLKIRSMGQPFESGLDVTLSFSDYGYPLEFTEDHIQLQMNGEETVLIDPKGNINANSPDLSALDIASVEERPNGFTIFYAADGSTAVTYDGTHGLQYLTVLDNGAVLTGSDPNFDTVIPGSWIQSWILDYETPSVSWSGEEGSFFETASLTDFRLTSLSWAGILAERDFWNFQILLKDGTLAPIQTAGESHGGYGACTDLRMTVYFSVPIDLANTSAVVINGIKFPVS